MLATAAAIAVPLLDMLPSHRLGLPPYEFDKPRLSGLDYLLIERRDQRIDRRVMDRPEDAVGIIDP